MVSELTWNNIRRKIHCELTKPFSPLNVTIEPYTGVSDIKCDVANKSVVVTASDDVKPEDMLAKLMKWSNASGKSVKLVQ